MDFIIVGAGQFGSALSQVYLKQGLRVFCIKKNDPWPTLTRFGKKHTVILCVPTQKLPEVLEQRAAFLKKATAVISTAKGLIQKTGETPLTVLRKTLGEDIPLLILSGPSFASELKKGKPTALVLASHDRRAVQRLSKILSTPLIRIYKCYDPLGVEICGALKNVYAIAAGICAGLELGENARAALTTRALAEMTRVGTALGGETLTFFGLAGVGDLFLTSSSKKSRNFQFGYGLAKKLKPQKLLAKFGTIEGVWTAEVALKLCQKKHLRAPIIKIVASLITQKLTVNEALPLLMSRKVRHEFE